MTRHVSLIQTVFYVFAQSLGAIVGYVILYALLTSDQRQISGYGLAQPRSDLIGSQVFGYEFFGTFLISLTYHANVDPLKVDTGFKSLSIGLAVAVAHLFTVRCTL